MPSKKQNRRFIMEEYIEELQNPRPADFGVPYEEMEDEE